MRKRIPVPREAPEIVQLGGPALEFCVWQGPTGFGVIGSVLEALGMFLRCVGEPLRTAAEECAFEVLRLGVVKRPGGPRG